MRALAPAIAVAAAIGVGLLAVAADRTLATGAGTEERPAREATARGAARRPASGREASSARDSEGPGTRHTRVPAGVLVRAATRRAQERPTPDGPERRRARGEADVLSVEIDWHASSSAER